MAFYIFNHDQMLLPDSGELSITHATVQAIEDHITLSLQLDGNSILKCKDSIEVAEHSWVPLRMLLTTLSLDEQHEILRAYHRLNWESQSQFCSACGASLTLKRDNCKSCAQCHRQFFPKFSPAVMVLIEKGDEILLVQHRHRPEFYTAIAGFLDLGETAEQALHREVAEEVGLMVTAPRYFATQTWPFPDSFMIAFKATYVSGDIQIDPHELTDARWFKRDHLPNLPSTASVARRLIES